VEIPESSITVLSFSQQELNMWLLHSEWPASNIECFPAFRHTLQLARSGQWLWNQSQSHVTTDGQSVSQSWCRAPSEAHGQMLRTVRQLRFCQSGALSDERSGLSLGFGRSFVAVICLSH
jgi:hypothetical protein